MSDLTTRARRTSPLACLIAVVGCASAGIAPAQQDTRRPPAPPADSSVTIDGRVGLASLIALGDGHLQQVADFLEVVAASDAGRSADWQRIRGPLADVARHSVPAVLWFALPDGSYWTADGERATGNLASRAYFPTALAGRRVIGDLVVSRATNKSVAIVAVPLRGADGAVRGVLGASVYLDSLSLRIAREMDLPPHVIFYSIDAQPLGGLNGNVSLIFAEPLKLGADLSRAIRQMMATERGVVSYEFLNTYRTMLYRKSAVTGWWYAFGVAREVSGAGQ